MELKCKNCGASLKVNSELAFINCNYCVTNFKLDDEVKHVKIDDMELNVNDKKSTYLCMYFLIYYSSEGRMKLKQFVKL